MAVEDEVRTSITEVQKDYGDNAALLFGMWLLVGSPDIDDLARDNLLDGPDDKKIDFFRIDRDAGVVIIAQGYQAGAWNAVEAPANKASDLNTAISWLLDAPVETIPREAVRAAAQDLRAALEDGDVHSIQALYMHNARGSANAKNELNTVLASLRNKIASWESRLNRPIQCSVNEYGLGELASLYESRHSTIRVTDEVTITTVGDASQIQGPNWKAVAVSVQADSLVQLRLTYGDTLYSANIRDFLGSRETSRNINRQIIETATKEPEDFWVFNNGVTLITRRIIDVSAGSIRCGGIAVVNGAQTLGSLDEASSKTSLEKIVLMARIVESSDEALIQSIIRFNNTQNPIKPWELRVLDPVQERLQNSFRDDLNVTYQYRRGTSRRAGDDLLIEKLAPWLSSFYGDADTAHRNSPELFENEAKYRFLFSDHSNIEHLLFVYRVGEAVAATKDRLKAATENGNATDTEATLYGYFRYGSFSYVVVALCADILAELFGGGEGVKTRFVLSADLRTSRDIAIASLTRIVDFTLAPIPPAVSGRDAFQVFRSADGVREIRERVRVTVNQMKVIAPDRLDALKEGIDLLP